MVNKAPEDENSVIKDILVNEGTNPMLELQRSTARRLIGRHVQVACLDGRVLDGHVDWCSDCEIAVAHDAHRDVIALTQVVGMVRRAS